MIRGKLKLASKNSSCCARHLNYYLNLSIDLFPITLTPTLIPTLTLTQAVEDKIFLLLAGHVTKKVFCPQLLRE